MNVTFGNPAGASPAPVTEKVVTPTPVPGVVVESENTACPAVVSVPAAGPLALVPEHGDRVPGLKEIKLPRLNIVHNTGLLKDTFSPGEIVYNQTTVLFTPPEISHSGKVEREGTPPIDLVVLHFFPTRYVEKVVPYNSRRGRIFNTEADVKTAGGTVSYEENKLKPNVPLFEYMADAFVAIRRPEHCADDDTVFVYQVGDHKYALGLWSMKGSAYTVAKTAFFTPLKMGCLKKGGYRSYHFAVSTFEKPFGTGNKTWVPVCIPTKPTDAAFLAFAAEILNG